MSDFRHDLWKSDLEAYHRWKKFLEENPKASDRIKSLIKNRMSEIQARWPYHKMEE